MSTINEVEDKEITLQLVSKENEVFKIKKEVGMHSNFIRTDLYGNDSHTVRLNYQKYAVKC